MKATESIMLKRRAISGFFLFIFFAKMVISTGPLLVKYFDSEKAYAVILQLEIENHAKDTDTAKEKGGKEIYSSSHSLNSALNALQLYNISAFSLESRRHIQCFYPSVPTPPPNRLA